MCELIHNKRAMIGPHTRSKNGNALGSRTMVGRRISVMIPPRMGKIIIGAQLVLAVYGIEYVPAGF